MTTYSPQRRRTSADAHRDRIEALIRATPGTLYANAQIAEYLGISTGRFVVIKHDMVEGGRLSIVETLLGPGGGTVYALPTLVREGV